MLRKRELGFSSEKVWLHRRTAQNIQNNCCHETIFKDNSATSHQSRILTLFTRVVNEREAFAITMDYNQMIRRWNLITGKCDWKCQPKPFGTLLQGGKLCFNEDAVICYRGRFEGTNLSDGTIYVIEMKTGIIKHHLQTLEIKKIYGLGKNIFMIHAESIEEICFQKGYPSCIINTPNIVPLRRTVAESERFLIDKSSKTNIVIYDRRLNKKSIIQVSTINPYINSVSCSYVSDSNLYCGFTTFFSESKVPAFCKIDLEKRIVVSIYLTHMGKYSYNSVCSLLIDGCLAYLGDSSGKVMAVNLFNGKGQDLAADGEPVLSLFKEDKILVGRGPSEIKFWDLTSMTLLKTLELPELSKISIVGKKVLALVGNNLIEWDFNCPQSRKT